MVVLVILTAPQILFVIYRRENPQSIATLRWLAVTLWFYFLNIPNARLIILHNMQNLMARFFGTSAAANLLAGFLLIPGYGPQGVAVARVISMAVHLVNTFLLLACLTLTAWWASGGKPLNLKGQQGWLIAFGIGFLGVIVLGVSGAVTALGDTLFPVESLAEGIQQDFSENAHITLRLRVWHPLIAITIGFYLFFLTGLLAMFKPDRQIRTFAAALGLLFLIQLIAGAVNLALLAPVWMQLVHLLLADLVWIFLVLLAAVNFAVE